MKKSNEKDKRRSLVAGCSAALVLLWISPATAQTASRAAEETTIPGGALVLISYIVLWLMFGGALLFALLRQRKLQREIDGLEERIDALLGTEEL